MIDRIMTNSIYYLYKIMRVVINIFITSIDLLIHPFKNISVWLIVFMTCFFYKNNVLKFNPKEMFLFSAGLITILTFIVTYLNSNTIDSNQRENYYLGFNLRKRNLHENYWIKRFVEIPIKCFLWIIACIPVLMLSVENVQFFKELDSITIQIANYEISLIEIARSIWLATVTVTCFLCANILIESVHLSSRVFQRSKIYGDKNWLLKYSIERELENSYELEFIKLFENSDVRELCIRTSEITDFIFTRAKETSTNPTELCKYIKIAYGQEVSQIAKLLEKLNKLTKKLATISEDKKNLSQVRFLIGHKRAIKVLEKIHFYFRTKWESIDDNTDLDNASSLLMQIAKNDLNKLLEMEKIFDKFKNSELKKLSLEYHDLFWGKYRPRKRPWQQDTRKEENLCVAEIINFVENILKNPIFCSDLNYREDVKYLLDVINRCDDMSKENNYHSVVIECIFNSLFKSLDNQYGFFCELKQMLIKQNYEQLLVKEISLCAYDKILSGYEYSPDQLTFILNLLDKKKTIIALIFNLAYVERSNRPIMDESEFNIWKSQFIKLDQHENSLEKLEKNNFLSELKEEISKSNVSHFIFDKFLSWLWDSLFLEFNKEQYVKFNLLGVDGVRRNFSLASYMILRLLVLGNSYNVPFNISEFNEKEKEKLVNELKPLQVIGSRCQAHLNF